MKIRKAVITAAGRAQRALPLQTLVDRDGQQKSGLQIIIDEALSTGVEEICVVVAPRRPARLPRGRGRRRGPAALRRAAVAARVRARAVLRPQLRRRRPVPAPRQRPPVHQPRSPAPLRPAARPRRRGRGVLPCPACSRRARTCCPTTAPSAAAASAGRPTCTRSRTSSKSPRPPRPSSADRPGPAGGALPVLLRHARADAGRDGPARRSAGDGRRTARPCSSRPPWRGWRGKERYLALEIHGLRYNIGVRYGLLVAQLALALDGEDREEILAQMIELLAARGRRLRDRRRRAWHGIAPRAFSALSTGGTPVSRDPMPAHLTTIITSDRPRRPRLVARRVLPRRVARRRCCASATSSNAFRRPSDNLYERVRALFFLYAIHRFHVPAQARRRPAAARIPFDGYKHLLNRRFEEAIDAFLDVQRTRRPQRRDLQRAGGGVPRPRLPDARQPGPPERAVGPRQPVDVPHRPPRRPAAAHPARSCCSASPADGSFPILAEKTPVRMDLTHSAWSDIFFLGMDFPEGARVLNVSIDLAVRGRDTAPKPPVEAYLRVIDEPVLRLVSVDLGDAGRHHVAARSVRLRPRLPRPAEGRGDRVAASCRRASKAPGAAAGRPARARRRAGAGAGDRQQRQQHPQGLAPRRLDQPARLAHRRLHARDRPGEVAHRPARGRRAPPRRRPRDPRRMDRRLRRRVAGLRRRLAGHEAHHRRAAPARATRVRRQPRPAAAQPPHPRRARRPRSRPPASSRTASSSSTAAWRRTSARSSRWSPRNTCSAPRPSGPAGSRRSASSTRSSPRSARGDVTRHRRRHHAQLLRPDPDDHPLGQHLLHRDAHRPRPRTLRRRLLGLLDARRHVRRRHGLHLRPAPQSRGPGLPPGDHEPHEARAGQQPAVRDGAGRVRLRDQPARHVRRRCSRATPRCCRRLLRADGAAVAADRPAAARRRCAARSSTASAPPAAATPELAGMVETLFDRLLPRGRRRRRATQSLDRAARPARLRPRAARADPRRPEERPDGLAQNRLPASTAIEDVRDGDVDGRRRAAVDPQWAKLGREILSRGEVAVADARRRRGQPLDAGGRRREGAAPVLQARRAAPHVHRGAPRQEPPGRHARTARRSRTSSPPATSPTSRSSSASPPREQLRLPRPAAPLARPRDRPAAGADGARPALRLGGDAAAAARRAGAEGPREPARRPDQLGHAAPARPATTPTTSRRSACTPSATGSRCPTCCATASSPACSTSGRS